MFGVLGAAVLGLGAAAWWLRNEGTPSRGAQDTSSRRDVEPIRPPTQEKAPRAGAAAVPRPIPLPFVRVYGKDRSRPATLLAIRWPDAPDDARLHYCIPAALLPTDGPLTDADGTAIAVELVAWDRVSGLMLLVGPPPTPEPEGFRVLTVREPAPVAADEVFDAVDPRGAALLRVRTTRRGSPLQFDRRLEPGSAVLDAAQRAVAVVGPLGGLLLAQLQPWRKERVGTSLAAAQKELRSTDIQAILADCRALLAGRGELTKVERAIELLASSEHLGRDHATIEELDKLQRFAHHQRVRLLLRTDPPRALRAARDSANRYRDHAALLIDLALLELALDDPVVGLRVFDEVRRGATPPDARVTGEVVTAVRKAFRASTAAHRLDAAGTLYRETARVLPEQTELLRWMEGALSEGSRSSSVVVIPFDPGSNEIRTTGTIRGRQLDLIVDTGASYTTIPSAMADALGLRKANNPRIKVQTASGTVDAEQVVLPELTVAGKLQVQRVKAVVLDLPGANRACGLLGLNVLKRLNMRIDGQRSRLILRQGRKNR
ncbi:MAG: retroviral-like aspartic protease family protein [Planctomycetes bacterium]|nr:retroviral-like aspartic protease family protein [Planctomycetota bacterium]MCB9872427.1 retroviral-like aspartic protease family protein [Planctomycetota bacterium]MCB9888372.1 retroviral-like aspartic protease family protein [Planctomycetota bacterium]